MKNRRGIIPLVLGALLLCGAVGLLAFSQIRGCAAESRAEKLAQRLEELLPERTAGRTDPDDPAMPVLQVEGTDLAGLLEVPVCGVSLPVCDRWDTAPVTELPCRYWGSAYDGSLVIGGGQMEFCGKLDIGDAVSFTDVAGARFVYRVQTVERASAPDAGALVPEENGLTLFTGSTYGPEYILVKCVPEG